MGDYWEVRGRIPKADKHGEPVFNHNLGVGGFHRDDGTFSAMVEDISLVDDDEADDDDWCSDDASASTGESGASDAAAALVALGIGVFATWGVGKVVQRRAERQARKEAEFQARLDAALSRQAPPVSYQVQSPTVRQSSVPVGWTPSWGTAARPPEGWGPPVPLAGPPVPPAIPAGSSPRTELEWRPLPAPAPSLRPEQVRFQIASAVDYFPLHRREPAAQEYLLGVVSGSERLARGIRRRELPATAVNVLDPGWHRAFEPLYSERGIAVYNDCRSLQHQLHQSLESTFAASAVGYATAAPLPPVTRQALAWELRISE